MPRPRAWADAKVNSTVLTGASASSQDILLDLASDPIDTVTVTRLVGVLTVLPILAIIAQDYTQAVHVGIGVASRQAFTAGAASLPNPNVTAEYPPRGWLYVTSMWLFKINSTTHDDHYPEIHFDIRTMRKLDKGVLFLALHNEAISGSTEDLKVGGRIRALCLT